MHDLLTFHSLHGSGATLSSDRSSALRSSAHCQHALVFSERPLKVRQKLCFTLATDGRGRGGIRIGLTSFDPSQIKQDELPPFLCPYYSQKAHYWTCALREDRMRKDDVWTVRLTDAGELLCLVNSVNLGSLIGNLPTNLRLWVIWDIFGCVSSIHLLPTDNTPLEILLQGPLAAQSYQSACQYGTLPQYRSRVMVVGPTGSGKTLLKRKLLGQSCNVGECRTEGIDVSSTSGFTSGSREPWKIDTTLPSIQPDTVDDSLVLDDIDLMEHYNYLQQLVFYRECDNPSQESQLLKDIPIDKQEKLLDSVNEVLQQQDTDPTRHQIDLSIWDFGGETMYYTTHQVFLSSRAVYLVTFNLCHDLDSPTQISVHTPRPAEGLVEISTEDDELSTLDYLHYWLASIHAHTAQAMGRSVPLADEEDMQGARRLAPPIFIVGTHKAALPTDKSDQMIKEKFTRIRCSLEGKSYESHVNTEYYAVDCTSGDSQVESLREAIQSVVADQIYVGEHVPVRWFQLEQAIAKLAKDGTSFTSLEQINHLALDYGIADEIELDTWLTFYHDLGSVLYFGCKGQPVHSSMTLKNLAILQPTWLVTMFKNIIGARPSQADRFADSWFKLLTSGMLEEQLLNKLCPVTADRAAILAVLTGFDLLCEYTASISTPKLSSRKNRLFFSPASIQPTSKQAISLYDAGQKDAVIYYDFSGFLPMGLFHRLQVRCARWSQETLGHMPQMSYQCGRFGVDQEHDFIIEVEAIKLTRIKFVVQRVMNLSDSGSSSVETLTSETSALKHQCPPRPAACAKIRNFLETTLSELRERWVRRLRYQACVQCTCVKTCGMHGVTACTHIECVHLLNLDHCLANKVVSCDHRRVKTAKFRKWFPAPVPPVFLGPVLPDKVVSQSQSLLTNSLMDDIPHWIRVAAKMLNGGQAGEDWLALAKALGYKKSKIEEFERDSNPGLMLLTDWIICSGNTSLSVDMILTFLELINREDIADIIQKQNEGCVDPPQVFLSYQWDHQDDVSLLRERLEASGFTCWMDIGQMGGGDELYARIDQGVRNAKVVVACLSPKYLASHYCTRELHLADMLTKPIIPVLMEPVPWPPPGALALVLAQLVYINMKGVGGHGGSGIHGDMESCYEEILNRVSCYATPVFKPQIDLSHMQISQTDADSASTDLVIASTMGHSHVIQSSRIRSAVSARTTLQNRIELEQLQRQLNDRSRNTRERTSQGCHICRIL